MKRGKVVGHAETRVEKGMDERKDGRFLVASPQPSLNRLPHPEAIMYLAVLAVMDVGARWRT